MYKVGMFDNKEGLFGDYINRMKKEDIELSVFEGESKIEEILAWITANEIQLLLVGINYPEGVEVALCLIEGDQNFPVVLLEEYPKEINELSREELLDAEIYNIDIINNNGEDFKSFCNQLKHTIDECYANTD